MSVPDETQSGSPPSNDFETSTADYDLNLPDIDLGMNDTDPGIIDRQIHDGITAYGGSSFGFVNNFFGSMPGGYKRRLAEAAGMMNRDRVDHSNGDTQHSKEFSGYSFADFFEDIDGAIERSGIDQEELTRLQATYAEFAGGPNESAALEALCSFIIPVYRELRIMGYSHYDMWG